MGAIALSKNFEVVAPEARLKQCRRRWALGLAVSCLAAFLAGLLGLVLGTISLLHIIPAGGSSAILGPALLVAAFPLLILAAHCMDKIDEGSREIREVNDLTR